MLGINNNIEYKKNKWSTGAVWGEKQSQFPLLYIIAYAQKERLIGH